MKLNPVKVNSPPYGWRSITSIQSLVNKDLIKRVGTRETISVWIAPPRSR